MENKGIRKASLQHCLTFFLKYSYVDYYLTISINTIDITGKYTIYTSVCILSIVLLFYQISYYLGIYLKNEPNFLYYRALLTKHSNNIIQLEKET